MHAHTPLPCAYYSWSQSGESSPEHSGSPWSTLNLNQCVCWLQKVAIQWPLPALKGRSSTLTLYALDKSFELDRRDQLKEQTRQQERKKRKGGGKSRERIMARTGNRAHCKARRERDTHMPLLLYQGLSAHYIPGADMETRQRSVVRSRRVCHNFHLLFKASEENALARALTDTHQTTLQSTLLLCASVFCCCCF